MKCVSYGVYVVAKEHRYPTYTLRRYFQWDRNPPIIETAMSTETYIVLKVGLVLASGRLYKRLSISQLRCVNTLID